MSIKIITYSDPYKIDYSDACWPYFINSIQFCASQTMVNGLMQEYKDRGLKDGQLIPVESLINSLFNNWNEIGHKMGQFNAVSSVLKTICLSDDNYDLVRNSLELNNQEYLFAIRLLFELDINLESINQIKDLLTQDQLYLVAAYERLYGNESFMLKTHFSEEEIERVIQLFVDNGNQNEGLNLNANTIVFNGIHQFSPLILRAIYNIAEYKDVVLMFNYVDAYSKTYETWLNVYSQFGVDIEITRNNTNDYTPINDSQMLGVQLAQMLEGTINVSARIPLSNTQMLVFDNTTEFARYVADRYEEAIETKKKNKDYSHNVLAFMNEQFYSAKSDVNKILRIYYPEQFGEQRFLNFPIGRFFVAIAEMWNSDANDSSASFRNISECLLAGIIKRDSEGKLNETLIKCKDYIGNFDYLDLDGVISKLNTLKSSLGYKLKKNISYKKISYFNCQQDEIAELISGLTELRQISEEFFFDFSSHSDSFKVFYKKVYDFLKKRVQTEENLDLEFRSILERLLDRLDNTSFPDTNPTFSCLRQTMVYYLDQEEKPSARWIVRNFEQIEGDILRSNHSSKHQKYHFCCVSDADMSVNRLEQYPWPLNNEFFEHCSDVDSREFRIYKTSRKERKNFKRYSLIYGLLYNKADLVISYVKNENDKVNDQYFLLKLLGIPEIEYARTQTCCEFPDRVEIELENTIQRTDYTNHERLRYYLCPLKFAYDSILNEGTIYKDSFMIKKYIAVIIAEKVSKELNGIMGSEIIVDSIIERVSNTIRNDYSCLRDAEWADVVADARDVLMKYHSDLVNGKTSDFLDCMMSRKNWSEANQNYLLDDSIEQFESATRGTSALKKRITGICKTCVDREICKVAFRGN